MKLPTVLIVHAQIIPMVCHDTPGSMMLIAGLSQSTSVFAPTGDIGLCR